MKLLAIDTSTEACSAALLIDGAITQRYRVAPREHTRLILPMIDELLNEAGFTAGSLDAVAFGRGPGAFTGLRIAASVIQGIAFAADLPVAPVSSLAALAQGAHRETGAPGVLAAIDARIQEVYWGVYRCDDSGHVRLVGDESVSSPEQVSLPGGDGWVGAGSGWGSYPERLQRRLAGSLTGWDARRYPHARDVAVLGADALGRGGMVSAERALPVYLRNEVAVKGGR
ncbi:MAG: tRNA (adenosine(37)-N6)-threonylcarbamoyltransferase complex dimerization subunit type 1 TsaB [Gammaproteobacteria bacterium]|jgi:tRNA threonylcarbamoyladenosine biosynthesis protein TsaB